MRREFSGRRLREARIAAGISPEQLAVELRRSAHSVQEYERGRVIPPVNVLVTAASLLGCSLDDLIVDAPAVAA